MFPPSSLPYDLSDKATDHKNDDRNLDANFLSNLDFVFDHLDPDHEPLGALWKYELNVEPDGILSPVTSMYGTEAKNKLQHLCWQGDDGEMCRCCVCVCAEKRVNEQKYQSHRCFEVTIQCVISCTITPRTKMSRD